MDDMSHSDDAKQINSTITQELSKLTDKIQELEKENQELRKKIKQLDEASDEVNAADFGINVDDEKPVTKKPKKVDSSIPAPSNDAEDKKAAEIRSQTQEESHGISSKLGPESIDETNIDELLANDALASTVYNRLEPLGSIKYRLLAMQLGISVDRCKEAVEKLASAGAVILEEDGVVKTKK